MNNPCLISVIIPTWRRKRQLLETLIKIQACYPCPAEILVHVDAGDEETEPWLCKSFPNVRVLKSSSRVGPGGGRNKLILSANHPIIASFDDDSYPFDIDYFARLGFCFDHYPDISILASQIIEPDKPIVEARKLIGLASYFVGCGVAYRREDFLASKGYIPLAAAYGMEEVELCIRFFDEKKHIYFSPWLRVFHNTTFAHHNSHTVTSASICNLALLAFLRYPKRYWIYGGLQVLNRIIWLMRAKRFSGIGKGIVQIPYHLWEHKQLRQPVSIESLQDYFRVRESVQNLMPLPDIFSSI